MSPPSYTATIWVIDDCHADAARVERALAAKHRVEVFEDPSVALERLPEGPPSLLVVDWVFPDASGLDVCRYVAATMPEIPILMVTSRRGSDDLAEAIAAGASDYAVKPVDETELLARTESLLRTARLLQRANHAEAVVSDLLRAAPDPLFALDHEGVVLYANERAARAVGQPSQDTIGMPLGALISSLDGGALVGREGVSPLVMRDLHLADRIFEPIVRHSDGGGPICAILALRDVTTRRRREQQQLDLYAKIIHDLRSPLSAMMLRADIALDGRRGILSSEMIADLRNMQRNIRELTSMVNDLLEIGRYSTAGFPLEWSTVSLARLLEQLIVDYGPLAEAGGIELVLSPVDSSLVINADPERLRRAIANLVGNAVKFTPKGGSVTVAASQAPDGIEIVVSDTGPGIDEATRRQIFERYFRASERHHEVSGSGLGLLIVREIVELHGGRVGVDSTPGQGSRFWIRLPRAVLAAAR